jgi:uncharacterized protein
MSQENVEIVRRMYEAVNRRDLDAWSELLDPEIEYHDAPGLPGGGVHNGREAVRRHAEGYLDAWSEARVEADPRLAGNQLIARLRYTGTGRTSGIDVETPEFGAVFDLRGDRISRVRQFTTYADALEAAGLSE